jgi:hypothetical protein
MEKNRFKNRIFFKEIRKKEIQIKKALQVSYNRNEPLQK